MSEVFLAFCLPVAFVCGVLSGMGIGSAGLFLLFLTLPGGLERADAQGVNLLFFLCSAGAALGYHAVRGRRAARGDGGTVVNPHRYIPRALVVLLTLAAVPGVMIGTYLLRTLNPDIIRRLFGGVLVLSGVVGLLGGRRGRTPQQKNSHLRA